MKRFFVALWLIATFAPGASAADKHILLIAGRPSHGHMEHEYRAGCLLLQKCLAQLPGVKVNVATNDWPTDARAFEGVDAVFIFSTGGGAHPAIKPDRLELLDGLMKKGVGFGTCHYAVEVPKDKGGPEFLRWQGGYFEMHWSVNPHWTADFKELPKHPITRGVKPFQVNDEWYYHMRFVEDMKGVTPILTALPPASTLNRPDGPHSGNPAVREAIRQGKPQHVAWAYERPDGGRGFGFTGAHYHKNFGDENFRKIVLNAILWIAKAEVPPEGVECTVTAEDLKANLDPKGR
ncbi:MAG: ThuA domain-containing protein [Verrucomicrobiota bacterium]